MKTLICAAALAAFGMNAAANDILLEACNNILDPAKRLECLKAIPKSDASAPAAEVERAFNDLRSILNSGTSFNSYSAQVETAVKATGHFARIANTPQQVSAAKLLNESLQAHKDALAFWQADIRWYADRGNYTSWPGGLPVDLTGTGYLVSRYNLQTRKSDFWGLSQGLPKLETLTAIWAVANQRSDEAFRAISNPAPQSEAVKTTSIDLAEPRTKKTMNAVTVEESDAVQQAGAAAGCHSIHTPSRTSTAQGVSFFVLKCSDNSSIQVVCSENTCQIAR